MADYAEQWTRKASADYPFPLCLLGKIDKYPQCHELPLAEPGGADNSVLRVPPLGGCCPTTPLLIQAPSPEIRPE